MLIEPLSQEGFNAIDRRALFPVTAAITCGAHELI